MLLASLGASFLIAKRIKPPLDPITNCPISGPTGIYAILIDKSDSVSPIQAQQISQYLHKLIDHSARGERFDLFVADGSGASIAKPTISLCNPGSGENANQLYENPKRIAEIFQNNFTLPMDRALQGLMEPSSRPVSPILESIREVAVTSFGPIDRGQQSDPKPLRLVIVSDMIQNTPLFSQVKENISFDSLKKQSRWRLLQANLAGASVDILYLLRPGKSNRGDPIQTRAHQAFWEHAIEASGGILKSLESY